MATSSLKSNKSTAKTNTLATLVTRAITQRNRGNDKYTVNFFAPNDDIPHTQEDYGYKGYKGYDPEMRNKYELVVATVRKIGRDKARQVGDTLQDAEYELKKAKEMYQALKAGYATGRLFDAKKTMKSGKDMLTKATKHFKTTKQELNKIIAKNKENVEEASAAFTMYWNSGSRGSSIALDAIIANMPSNYREKMLELIGPQEGVELGAGRVRLNRKHSRKHSRKYSRKHMYKH